MADEEEPMDTGNDSNGMNTYYEESNGGKNNSLDYNPSNCQKVPNGTTQKKDSVTIHLNVVWPEEKPPLKWEIQLRKALQSWFNKNKSKTECLSLTANEHGSVKMEVSPASGQEDLFTQETKLTLKDQTTVSVKRDMPWDLMSPMTNDFDVTSSVTPSAPPETVSCSVPLGHFCYVNQICREKMKRIEEENGVQIQSDVTVSFTVNPGTGGDPQKALSDFTDLVQSCLGKSNLVTYTNKLGQVDWEKAIKCIQKDENLTLTVSSHEVDVCGPMRSLENFESITKMQKKILITQIPGPSSAREVQAKSHRINMNFRDPLLSSGLTMNAKHWVVITTTFKNKLAELESRFGVTFHYSQGKVRTKAKPEMSEYAITLESHALRALLCLYQRVATSVMSCSVLSPNLVSMVEGRLSGHPGIVPDPQGDQWRIIGLPENLCQAVEEIECNLGIAVFKDEDKKRIEHSRYRVQPSGSSDVAGGKRPVRGATAAEDLCPICLDSFTNKTTLKCTHMFCKECLEKSKTEVGPTCPVCRALLGTFIGDQPDGQMTWQPQQGSLPGYKGCGKIIITYDIYAGIQTAKHPNPGMRHPGTQRCAYLPDNYEGREVLRLLKRAFDQKLIFTVGTSRTSGSNNQVTWNDIHHKTNIHGGSESFGYPDPDYLQRVKEELKAKGIE